MKKFPLPEPAELIQVFMHWSFVLILTAYHPDLAERKNLVFRLNRFLPKDISVSGISKVLPDAHARFSAVSRTYRYYISRVKDPFLDDSSWFVHGKIDVNMNEQSMRDTDEIFGFYQFQQTAFGCKNQYVQDIFCSMGRN